ncbi:class I adenylate-forming enzyme family protein [Brevundimonas staleyi]|uniref:Class I adenylate-forming enzyme family protein n=1 Tax=Brevundimonas staleyi TaxID=74326 RepID=A0ABW0FNA0_9CAUL
MNPIRALYEHRDAKVDRPALFDGETTLTHGALIALVECAAADLATRGIGPGDRVGLCARNSWRHVVAYLSILRANAVWMPLNPRNGARLNSDFQARANPALTLIDAASVEAAGASPRPLPLEAWLDGVGDASPPAILDEADAPFALKFTGGSTGVPKGVVQSQASGAAALRSLSDFYGFTADDVNLAVAPLTHGSSHYVLPVLAAGGAHVLLPEPDRAAILRELKTRVSTVFMPPTLIALLMGEAAFAPADFPRLRHLTYSAAPMSPDRIAQAIHRFGPVVSTLYGQTEAPMTIAGLSPADMTDPDKRAGVGRPFDDTPVRLLTAGGDLVERGEGEIVVGGDLTRTYYLDAPELTAASRHDGWLKTGDIGRIGEDGLLYLIGRSKDLIITGGYNVYPGEVEAALNLHPMVREACAFAELDDVWGERLEAAVAASPDADPAVITAFVRDRIGPVRTPKRLHILPDLPRNPVGKVVRDDVRALCRQSQTRPLELAR